MTEQERAQFALALRAYLLSAICVTRQHLGSDDPQWVEADQQLRELVPVLNREFGRRE
jgi:hypothetical protein